MLGDIGDEITRSGKPTSVNESFCPAGLDGLCTVRTCFTFGLSMQLLWRRIATGWG